VATLEGNTNAKMGCFESHNLEDNGDSKLWVPLNIRERTSKSVVHGELRDSQKRTSGVKRGQAWPGSWKWSRREDGQK
jgi:hypothetical protein